MGNNVFASILFMIMMDFIGPLLQLSEPSLHRGSFEINISGEIWNICEYDRNRIMATVTCKQLGYRDGRPYFG